MKYTVLIMFDRDRVGSSLEKYCVSLFVLLILFYLCILKKALVYVIDIMITGCK